jgi:hypothetical protein
MDLALQLSLWEAFIMINNLATDVNHNHILNKVFLSINVQNEQNYLNQARNIDNFIVITI